MCLVRTAVSRSEVYLFVVGTLPVFGACLGHVRGGPRGDTKSHEFRCQRVAGTSVRMNVIGGNNVFVVDCVLSLLCCSRVVPI